MYLEELFGLKGKVAVVTGGGRGIGQVIAEGLAKAGAEIVIVARSGADETIKLIEQAFRYRYIYPMAIDAVAAGKVNLKGIVTDLFEFDEIQSAMDKSVEDKANIVKAVVKIS